MPLHDSKSYTILLLGSAPFGVSLFFCSNLVKLDELRKIYNDNVENLQGYFREFS